jgi:hypothetical protein
MRRSLPFLALALSAFGIVGCGGSSAHPAGQGITVTVTGTFANNTIQAGDPAVTLQAAVANDSGKKGVTWALSVANAACSPGCGTLAPIGSPSFSATYTPPATAPLNQQATITATSVADPNQSFTFIFTIEPLTTIAITTKFATTLAGGPGIQVNANVKDDPTGSGVTWALTAGGTNCSPDCGTLAPAAAPSFAALYTPPATVPAGAAANPTITATSVHLTSATDSFSFTIANATSLVKGNFSFVLRGYDPFSGSPMAMAGSVVADGNGNITGGEIDINNGGGLTVVTPPISGVYSVDNSFHGIAKGVIEITSFTFPSSNIDLKFRFVLSADGTRGKMIELDGGGYLNAGTMAAQDSAAIKTQPSGNYAFGLDSDAPFAGRTVAAGQLVFSGSGITGGVIDQSKSADPAPTYSGAAISAGNVTAPDANGRGTMVVNIGSDSTTYAYYVNNANSLTLIQIDKGLTHGTVQAGSAHKQNALTSDSINAKSVIQLTGMDEPTGTSNVGPAVIIGVLTISGGNSFVLNYDFNDIGSVSASHFTNGSIASFDPATGRAVVSAPGDFQAGFVDSAVIYLYDQGAGYFIDTDISTPDGTPPDQAITNNAFSGTLIPQASSSFSSASLNGNVLAGFGGSASPAIPNFELAMNFDGTTGNYTAAGDLTSLPSQDGQATGAQFNGNFAISNTNIGHGTITLPSAVFGDFTSGGTSIATFYLIGPNQFVAIGVNPVGQYSGVMFFDPQ